MTATLTIKQRVFTALNNALENGFVEVCWHKEVKAVAEDLIQFDANLEDANPNVVASYVLDWRCAEPLARQKTVMGEMHRLSTPGQQALYHCMMAWQHFGGKSMRTTDSFEVLTDADVINMTSILSRVVRRLRQEDPTSWPDCHKLADQIDRELSKCR